MYLLTAHNDFYKIDTRDRSYLKTEEVYEFAGSGIDFTLTLKDKNVYSKGANTYGQLGCADFRTYPDEQFVSGIPYPVKSVFTGGCCCFAAIEQNSVTRLYLK